MKKTLVLLCIIFTASCSSMSSGAHHQVTVAADSAWDQQPDQLEALRNKVYQEWNRNITMNQVSPPTGTIVRIKIRFYADGGEPYPISVKGGSRKAKRACAQALLKVSEAWSEEMIKDLGTQRTLTFTFTYS